MRRVNESESSRETCDGRDKSGPKPGFDTYFLVCISCALAASSPRRLVVSLSFRAVSA